MLRSDPRGRVGQAEVDELDDRIEKLRYSYEMFFLGIDNIDPSDKKVPIRRLITRLNELSVRNPAVRFRFQSLVGRFVSLNHYWERMMRAIEDGQMERGINRGKLIRKDGPKAYYGKEAPSMGEEGDGSALPLDRSANVVLPQDKLKEEKRQDIRVQTIAEDDLATLRHKRPLAGPEAAAPASNGTPAPSNKPAVALDDRQIDHVYEQFVEARRRNSLPAEGVSKSAMKIQLEKQLITLREKYRSEEIEFRVVDKNGKVLLQPVVKKGK